MKRTVDPKHFSSVIGALVGSDFRTATKFLDEKTVVRATWQFKPHARNTREEIRVTFGAPNYLERDFIKKCKKAGEPLPVKKIQFRSFPVRKAAAK